MAVASPARRFVLTGGTDYPGCRLIPLLIDRGHFLRALTLAPSNYALPPCGEALTGNPLYSATSIGAEHRSQSKKVIEVWKNWTLGGVER